MSSTTAKSAKAPPSASQTPGAEFNWPFAAICRNQLLWSPYRAVSKLLLQTHRSMDEIVQINRKLADELLDIARREQDVINDIQEKMLQQISDGDQTTDSAGLTSAKVLAQYYDAVSSSARELSKAWVDAQTQSVEALREHTKMTAKTLGQAMTEGNSGP